MTSKYSSLADSDLIGGGMNGGLDWDNNNLSKAEVEQFFAAIYSTVGNNNTNESVEYRLSGGSLGISQPIPDPGKLSTGIMAAWDALSPSEKSQMLEVMSNAEDMEVLQKLSQSKFDISGGVGLSSAVDPGTVLNTIQANATCQSK